MNHRAFTLIELLVVIAIIAILIGITLPVLSSARQTARQTDCLADLRSMAQALTLYANDYKERLPQPNWGPIAAVKGWLYGPGVVPADCVPEDRQTGSLWSYLEVEKAYRCPSHVAPFDGTARMTSYIMNGAVISYGRSPATVRIGDVNGNSVLLWDGNEQPEFGPPYNDGASFPREIVPGHHPSTVTCVNADGSSDAMPIAEFFKLRDSGERNRFWWGNSENGR